MDTKILILKNKYLVKSKYKGQSKFNFWKKIDVGTILEISTTINPHSGDVPNLLIQYGDEARFSDSFNRVSNYLKNMELEQIN